MRQLSPRVKLGKHSNEDPCLLAFIPWCVAKSLRDPLVTSSPVQWFVAKSPLSENRRHATCTSGEVGGAGVHMLTGGSTQRLRSSSATGRAPGPIVVTCGSLKRKCCEATIYWISGERL